MMQTDPVCNMQIDTDRSQYKSDYQGKNYAFCSSACKQKFDQNPSEYTQKMAGQGQSHKQGQGGQGQTGQKNR